MNDSPRAPPEGGASSRAPQPSGVDLPVPDPAPEALAAHRLRREPYLILFPAGLLLAWAGVGHWLLHSLGVLADYRPIFHSMAQVQGFLTCFAVGFLFTMIPRRTGSAPASALEIAIGVMAPWATTVAAWREQWALSQIPWLILAGVLIQFAVRRFLSASSRRRPPNSFVWVPIALLFGVLGAVMTGAQAIPDQELAWLHDVGRALVLEGMFTALILGVGGLALPLMTRGDAPPDATASAADRRARLLHLGGALLLAASFFLGVVYSLRWGALLRAAVVIAVLLAGPQLWRRPRAAWNARLIWLAAWMIPVGSLFVAALPEHYRAGQHLTFVSGFALLALSVSTQVTLGHGGFPEQMLGRPWQVRAIGFLVLAAAAARVAMDIDQARFFLWMGVAAAFFLGATTVWLGFLLPKMWRPADST